MIARETVRSGRRANFYITENSFIDNYAKDAGPMGIAVYHVLERHMNFETKSTWVGTAKVAELLNTSQRTVQRTLNLLQDLKLIRIIRTPTMTTYVILPVPPRGKTALMPLFDGVEEQGAPPLSDTGVAWATSKTSRATSASQAATEVSRSCDAPVAAYKEEQDLLNKTIEQDFFNRAEIDIIKSAQTLVRALKLPGTAMSAAIAAVEETQRRTNLSMDGIVQDIGNAAIEAERRGTERHEFLESFLAEKFALQILKGLAIPDTKNLISTVAASVRAEMRYTGLTAEAVAQRITEATLEARRNGERIDRFYFENTKWRDGNGSAGRTGTAVDRVNRNRESLLAAARSHAAERDGSDGSEREGGANPGAKQRMAAGSERSSGGRH
jgi:hypothetical protein